MIQLYYIYSKEEEELMRYKGTDLHGHTRISDGKKATPESYMFRAVCAGVTTFSYTEHNSLGSYRKLDALIGKHVERLEKYGDYRSKRFLELFSKLNILTGAEFLVSHNGSLCEILAYGFDREKMREEYLKIAERLPNSRKTLSSGIEQVIKQLGLGDLSSYDRESSGLSQSFFNALKKEYSEKVADFSNLSDFIYEGFYNPYSEFYLEKFHTTKPPIQDMIDAIHKAGGKAILAHPGKYRSYFDITTEGLEKLISMGMDGLEVFHPKNNREVNGQNLQDFLLNFIRTHNQNREPGDKELVASGGSDDHQKSEPGQYHLGEYNLPDILETQWVRECLLNGGNFVAEMVEKYQLTTRLEELHAEKSTKQKMVKQLKFLDKDRNTIGPRFKEDESGKTILRKNSNGEKTPILDAERFERE